jgi:hypothetical protein
MPSFTCSRIHHKELPINVKQLRCCRYYACSNGTVNKKANNSRPNAIVTNVAMHVSGHDKLALSPFMTFDTLRIKADYNNFDYSNLEIIKLETELFII